MFLLERTYFKQPAKLHNYLELSKYLSKNFDFYWERGRFCEGRGSENRQKRGTIYMLTLILFLRQLKSIWMSIIVNSRISFVFALMKCSFAAFGEQNKIDNDSKCQMVYKSHFFITTTPTNCASRSVCRSQRMTPSLERQHPPLSPQIANLRGPRTLESYGKADRSTEGR